MTERVAIVTGGNRGLGLETCRQLAQRGLRVILTSRDEDNGKGATEQLVAEGLPVEFELLDVMRAEAIDRVRDAVLERHGRIDVVVNNAGVLLDPGWPVIKENMAEASVLKTPLDTVRLTMESNAYGALRICQRVVPVMKDQDYGRIVNVTSNMGQLSTMQGGWAAYRISKVALNAVTRVFAAELEGTNVLINSVSPGWVKTRIGGEGAPLSVEEGVDTIVWAATLPDGGPSGGFFRERQSIPW